MPRVFLSDAAFSDLLRMEKCLADSDDSMAGEWLGFILDALQVLTHQPGLGRPVESGLRELFILRNRSGYLARYEFDDVADLVLLARIGHQREFGCTAI